MSNITAPGSTTDSSHLMHQVVDFAHEPYSIVLFVFWMLHLLLWAALHLLRKEEPFASRRMMWTLISNVGGLIMVTVICIREQNPAGFSCVLYVILSNVFVYLYGSGYVVRAVWLHYLHSWNKTVCEYGPVKDFNHRWRATRYQSIILLFLSVAFAVHVTVVIMEVLRLARNSGSDYMTHGCWMDVELEVFLIQFGVYLILMVLMVLIIIKVSDAYWISTELRLCMLCWILFGGLFFLFTLLPQMEHASRLFPQSSWLLIAIGLTFLISDVCPLLVYLRARRLVKRVQSSQGFHRLIKDLGPDGEEILELQLQDDSSELSPLELQLQLQLQDDASEAQDPEQQPAEETPLEKILRHPQQRDQFRQMMMYWLRAEQYQFCWDVQYMKRGEVPDRSLETYCRTLYQKYLAEKSHSGDSVKGVDRSIILLAGRVFQELTNNEINSAMFDDIYILVRDHVEARMLMWFDPESQSGTPFLTPYKLFC